RPSRERAARAAMPGTRGLIERDPHGHDIDRYWIESVWTHEKRSRRWQWLATLGRPERRRRARIVGQAGRAGPAARATTADMVDLRGIVADELLRHAPVVPHGRRRGDDSLYGIQAAGG